MRLSTYDQTAQGFGNGNGSADCGNCPRKTYVRSSVSQYFPHLLTSKLQSPEAVEAVPASVELGRPIYYVCRVMNFCCSCLLYFTASVSFSLCSSCVCGCRALTANLFCLQSWRFFFFCSCSIYRDASRISLLFWSAAANLIFLHVCASVCLYVYVS